MNSDNDQVPNGPSQDNPIARILAAIDNLANALSACRAQAQEFAPIFKNIRPLLKARPGKGVKNAAPDAETDRPEEPMFDFDDLPEFGSDCGDEPEQNTVLRRAPAVPARHDDSAAEKTTGAAIEEPPFHRLVDLRTHLILAATHAQITNARSYEPQS
jgi:hypothetical protein